MAVREGRDTFLHRYISHALVNDTIPISIQAELIELSGLEMIIIIVKEDMKLGRSCDGRVRGESWRSE